MITEGPRRHVLDEKVQSMSVALELAQRRADGAEGEAAGLSQRVGELVLEATQRARELRDAEGVQTRLQKTLAEKSVRLEELEAERSMRDAVSKQMSHAASVGKNMLTGSIGDVVSEADAARRIAAEWEAEVRVCASFV